MVIDSTNHMSGQLLWGAGPEWAGAPGAAPVTGRGTTSFAPDWDHPQQQPEIPIAPWAYGWCNSYAYGETNWAPWAGGCAAHMGQMGDYLIDDGMLAGLRLR